ncbi:MAG: hypothetical protein QGG09_12960, partial [Pirellulaceae bacterium]|nr:hypothetical protein [Pirellulaceae bacterium]
MKTTILAFSLVAAVGIYFPASQLMATEPGQPVETTQLLDEPSAGNEVALEQDADLTEGLTVSEEQMIREEAVAMDELIDQAIANESGFQEIGEGLGDEYEQSVLVDEVDESESTVVAEEEAADELLESYELPNEETESVDVDDDVQDTEDAAAEDAEATDKEVTEFVTDEELSEEAHWDEGFNDWYYEDEVAAEESIDDATTVAETVEPTEAVEVEDNIDFVDSAIEETIGDETVYIVETEEPEATEATEEITIDEELAVEAKMGEHSSEESDEGEVATEDSIEEAAIV